MKPMLDGLTRLAEQNGPTFGPDLPNGYHENILRYEKEQAEYLKTIANNPFGAPPVLYSR